MGRCVALAEDGRDRRLHLGQGVEQDRRHRDRPAPGASAAGVARLQVGREVVDVGGVGDHQDRQVLAVHRVLVGGIGQVAPGLELERAPAGADAARADEGEGLEPVAQEHRRRAADDAAEGEADEMEALVLRDQPAQPVGADAGDRPAVIGLGRQGRIAEARQVGRQHRVVARQRLDVADPVRPGAEAAVEQHQRRPRTPAVPDHPAVAAGRRQALGPALDRGDEGGGVGRRHGATGRGAAPSGGPMRWAFSVIASSV